MDVGEVGSIDVLKAGQFAAMGSEAVIEEGAN